MGVGIREVRQIVQSVPCNCEWVVALAALFLDSSEPG